MVRGRALPLRPGRRAGFDGADPRAARQARGRAAVEPAQCGQRLPQPARRPRGAAHRILRAQGPAHRRGGSFQEACEFHRERGQRDRGRHRVAHRPRAGRSAREERRGPGARSPDRGSARVTAPGKVAVLMRGPSAEREISLISGKAVLEALRSKGVAAEAFDPAERELFDLKREGFKRAFIALHGRFGEDWTIQGALEVLRIPYTGSGVMASALAMDKWRTKLVWDASGIPTPRFAMVNADTAWDKLLDLLGLPMIIKPAR